MLHKKGSEARRYAASTDIPSKICAPNVSVQTIEFDDLLNQLQSDNNHRGNSVYMQVEWTVDAVTYKLICPCPYINFPPPKQVYRSAKSPITFFHLIL